jgi:D-alanyl-D-alanine carboxypeptidase
LRKVSRGSALAFVVAGLVVSAPLTTATAAPKQVDPDKYAAIVVDPANGRVLYEVNADARRYPASLTKMMTLYVMFEELDRGRFKMSTPLRVSSLAQRQSPTKLGLRAGETVSVEDAVKGLITRSANDAAVVIAENVAGSVPAFADRMTRTARALGMSRTRFNNPNGLPDPNNVSTARDLMKLGVALQVRFPQYYPLFSTRSYAFRGRSIGNHNNLLGRVDGVDGIKTGYVNASGFNIVTSVKRNGRKLVAVVMGGRTAAQRDAHMVSLINAYLPKATPARGFGGEVVASVMAAPKVAGATPRVAPEAAPIASLVDHPSPLPRPTTIAPTDDIAENGSPILPPAPVPAGEPAAVAAVAAVATPMPAASVPMAPPAPAAVAAVLPPSPAADPMPKSLATATLPASLAGGRLPSSAAEAFADVAPMPRPDPMAQLVAASAPARPYQVASADDGVVSDAAPAPAPVPMPAASVADATETTASLSPARQRAQSGWVVQIGTAGSDRAALDLLDKARSTVGAPLRTASPVTEAIRKAGQTIVRARFAGFSTEKSATDACNALKRKSFSCFTLRL